MDTQSSLDALLSWQLKVNEEGKGEIELGQLLSC
jgi:hypothetical protein